MPSSSNLFERGVMKTVKDLIEELQKLDGDSVFMTRDCCYGYSLGGEVSELVGIDPLLRSYDVPESVKAYVID